MVDEFMVCVDRIISSSAACFQESPSSSSSSVNSNNNSYSSSEEGAKEEEEEESSVNVSVCENIIHEERIKVVVVNNKDDDIRRNLRECRICQEEEDYDDDNDKDDMEAPCACNGTLKFAHRKCIQRWCNKKGDITCEICNQMFSPNYTSPPPKSNSHVMAIDIRQAWGPHVDLRDPRLLAFAAAERQFLQSEYDDYAIANSGTLTCFRSIAIILMLLLLIRQTLMVTKDFGMQRESSDFFHYQISILQLAGFLLPCYVVARSWYILQCRRRRQG